MPGVAADGAAEDAVLAVFRAAPDAGGAPAMPAFFAADACPASCRHSFHTTQPRI